VSPPPPAATPPPAPAADKIALVGVSKRFVSGRKDFQALDDVTLRVAPEEFVCLVGPSGCGKSTILNLVAGLAFPDKGEVIADGARVTGPGSDRMMMFQEAALFPWLDVMGNIMFGLNLKPGMTDAERRATAHHFLELVGLSSFRRSFQHELSGGMRQRTALARCLASGPRVLLMDEPFASLDALTREQLYGDLQRIWQEQRKTILFVTHNVREAACLGDRIVLLSPRPGRVREEFRIDLPRPRDINSPDLASLAREVTTALKRHLSPEDSGLRYAAAPDEEP
jgi:NitT/TauT family transport system ATP-binding protein